MRYNPSFVNQITLCILLNTFRNIFDILRAININSSSYSGITLISSFENAIVSGNIIQFVNYQHVTEYVNFNIMKVRTLK